MLCHVSHTVSLGYLWLQHRLSSWRYFFFLSKRKWKAAKKRYNLRELTLVNSLRLLEDGGSLVISAGSWQRNCGNWNLNRQKNLTRFLASRRLWFFSAQIENQPQNCGIHVVPCAITPYGKQDVQWQVQFIKIKKSYVQILQHSNLACYELFFRMF